MKKVSTTYARNNFQEIVNQASYGEEKIIITRHNKPVATISPFSSTENKSTINQPAISLAKNLTKKQAQEMFQEMKEPNEKSLS